MNKLRDVIRNNMSVILGVFVGIASLNIWVVIAFSIDIVGLKSTYEAIDNGFIVLAATAIGAISGSFFTYKVNRREEEKVKHLKRINGLHKIIYFLNMQKLAIEAAKKTMVKYEAGFDRGILMPEFYIPISTDLKLNIEEVSFIIEYKKSFTLMTLFNNQMLFDLALNSVKDRTSFYISRIQTVLHENFITDYDKLSLEDCVKIFDKQTFTEAISKANKMHETIELVEKNLLKTLNEICQTAKEIYPRETFDEYNEHFSD